ncbi:MAG: glycosyltransferase family 4 protein, partial [Tepidanaerobacteraceae bacterium]|nr:glycosyltransferase family 4 protein [Tepidanaerobacteraceae bacterium]
IIHNGIDLSKFDNVLPILRKELGLDSDIPVIGMVARLVPEKGYEYAINAFYQVLKVYSSARLVIVGDGPLKRHLKNICVKLGIKDKIFFLGYRRQVENIVADFDVFILPSISEGLGLALLEAMALRKPVVASEVGGIPEVVKNNINGLLVPPGNDRYLADRIIEVLSNNVMSKAMGIEAQKTVSERFSSQNMIKKTAEIYAQILGNTKDLDAMGLHN